MELSEYLAHVLKNYATNKDLDFKGNELSNFIRHKVIEIIPEFIFNSNDCKLKASAGNGQWASVPWFAEYNRKCRERCIPCLSIR